jgi:hypothetical protein
MNNEWQPIETAPKDGTHIIGLFNDWLGDCVSVTWYNKKSYSKKYGKTTFKKVKGWQNALNEDKPTHWIPLPKLPLQ